MTRKIRWLAGVGLMLGCLPTSVRGQTLSWNNPAGGSFNLGANWTPAGPPGVSQAAAFNLNSSYTVTFPNSVQNLSLVQSQGTVTMAIGASNTYTLTASNATAIGNTSGQTAILNIASGKLQINTAQGSSSSGIGTVAGSNGTLHLQGAGTTLTASNFLDIGESGNGRLEVYAGASASIGTASYIGANTGSTGVIEVANGTLNMSSSTIIGNIGSGEVILYSTSTGTFGTSLILGNVNSSIGKLTVGTGGIGPNIANTAGFTLGFAGTGILTIQSQSTLNNTGNAFIAYAVGSTGTANLIGGTWNQTGGSIYIGGNTNSSGGTGSINLSSQANLEVTGAANGIVVRGPGTLTINNLSTVTTPNLTNQFGTINMNGGSLIINGGTFNNNGASVGVVGTLALKNSAVLSPVPTLVVGSSAGSTLAMESGSTATATELWLGNGVNTTGTANITNSNLTTSFIVLGQAGGTGILDIGAGGIVNEASNGTWIGGIPTTGNGTVRIRSGGVLNSSSAILGNVQTTGTAHINGNWNITNTLEVGGQLSGSIIYPALAGTMNLNPGGAVQVGGLLKLYSAGVINLNGGTLQIASLQPESGMINFNAGIIKWTGSWNADYSQLNTILGTASSLGLGRTLQVAGTTTLQSSLQLDGGLLRTGSLAGAAFLALNSGTLEVTTSSLSVGSSGIGPLLTLGSGMNLRVTGAGQSLSVANDGVLYLNGGAASASIINNVGEINLNSPAASLGLAGQSLVNSGRLAGAGRINANLSNNANGRVISDVGQRLVFTGAINSNNANGAIEMSGGTVEFSNTLNNIAGGFISGRGVFRGSSGNTSGLGLNNQGVVAFSAGVSDVYGKVTNTATGQIITAGAGIVTFHDDVVHNGVEIRTGSGSRTVFLGAVSGAGPFTGTGTVEYQGDLRPGNSPANVNYAGNVEIGVSATSHFEIGGIVAGSEYDRLTVAGSIVLNGQLDIALINSFQPMGGQQFTLIDNLGSASIQGHYLGLDEGNQFLAGGQLWAITYQGGDGNNLVLTAVPEPTTWALLGLSGVASAWYFRKRFRSTQIALDNDVDILED